MTKNSVIILAIVNQIGITIFHSRFVQDLERTYTVVVFSQLLTSAIIIGICCLHLSMVSVVIAYITYSQNFGNSFYPVYSAQRKKYLLQYDYIYINSKVGNSKKFTFYIINTVRFLLFQAVPLTIPFFSTATFTVAILSEQFLYCFAGTLVYEEVRNNYI